MPETTKDNEAPNGPSASKALLDHCAIPYTNAMRDIIKNTFYYWRTATYQEILPFLELAKEDGVREAFSSLLAEVQEELLQRIDKSFGITRFAGPDYLNSPDEV